MMILKKVMQIYLLKGKCSQQMIIIGLNKAINKTDEEYKIYWNNSSNKNIIVEDAFTLEKRKGKK